MEEKRCTEKLEVFNKESENIKGQMTVTYNMNKSQNVLSEISPSQKVIFA